MAYRLPWHGQLIVPSATAFSSHPSCVQTMPNPRNSPAVGWVTTTRRSGKTRPPPTGISSTLATGRGARVAGTGARDAPGVGLADGAADGGAAGPAAGAQAAVAPIPAIAAITARRGTGVSEELTERPSHPV